MCVLFVHRVGEPGAVAAYVRLLLGEVGLKGGVVLSDVQVDGAGRAGRRREKKERRRAVAPSCTHIHTYTYIDTFKCIHSTPENVEEAVVS